MDHMAVGRLLADWQSTLEAKVCAAIRRAAETEIQVDKLPPYMSRIREGLRRLAKTERSAEAQRVSKEAKRERDDGTCDQHCLQSPAKSGASLNRGTALPNRAASAEKEFGQSSADDRRPYA